MKTKLALSRETIRHLDTAALEAVMGGGRASGRPTGRQTTGNNGGGGDGNTNTNGNGNTNTNGNGNDTGGGNNNKTSCVINIGGNCC
jgi:hypothetical protein